MQAVDKELFSIALKWTRSVLGPLEVVSDKSKAHGDHESAVSRIIAASGPCYLKIHLTSESWQHEVHAYENWAQAFGSYAPRLLAVRDSIPLALVINEINGVPVEHARLKPDEQRTVWREAGMALHSLHSLNPGSYFGSCLRDGSPAARMQPDPVAYIGDSLQAQIEDATGKGYLDSSELGTLEAALRLIPAFSGELPLACHRDYCAPNWLVSPGGHWAGVIDFEFAHWDVRAADFSRDPDWAWICRPDLEQAFMEGYGQRWSEAEQQQLLVSRAEYALSAIIWGHDYSFFGFEREGRAALRQLALTLG